MDKKLLIQALTKFFAGLFLVISLENMARTNSQSGAWEDHFYCLIVSANDFGVVCI